MGLLAAIARLLSTLLAVVRDERRKQRDEAGVRNAEKAAGHGRLLAALKARRKAQKQWGKFHDSTMADSAASDRNHPDS